MGDKWIIDYKDYLSMINSPAFVKLHQYYTQETIWDVLGVTRWELSHSNFLRWLILGGENRELGDIPVRKLIETACLVREELYHNGKELWHTPDFEDNLNLFGKENEKSCEEIKYGRYKVLDIKAKNEVALGKQRRADIFVGLKIAFQDNASVPVYLMIVVENKVGSLENGEQTREYAKAVSKKDMARDLLAGLFEIEAGDLEEAAVLVLNIYLNACGTREIKESLSAWMDNNKLRKKELPTSDQFITVNYQYLLDNMIAPCQESASSEATKSRIFDYIRCLGQAREEEDKTDKYLVMAISATEKRMAKELWEQESNKRPLIDIYQSMKSRVFKVNEEERRFYEALGRVYELLFEDYQSAKYYHKEEKEKIKELLDAIKASRAVNRANHIFIYKHKNVEQEYRSYTERSIGRLCRDVIEDAAKEKRWTRNDMEKFRRDMWKMKANWLREVVLFDNEAKKLINKEHSNLAFYTDTNYKIASNDEKTGYKTCCVEELTQCFFTGMGKEKDLDNILKFDPYAEDSVNAQIKLVDGTKAYVGRYWATDDFKTLVDVLKKKYGYNVNYKEIKYGLQ